MRSTLLVAAFVLGIAGTASAGVKELRAEASGPTDASTGLDLASRLRTAGLVTESTQVAQRALGKATDSDLQARLRLELARNHIVRGEMHQALAKCEQVRSAVPVLGEVCFAEAHLSFRRGSLALDSADAALQIDPGHYDGKLAKARALRITGETDGALKLFQDLIRHFPSRPGAYPYLAQLELDLGKDDDALATLRQALKQGTDDAVPRVMLARLLTPGDEALKLLAEALDLREGYVDTYIALGFVDLKLGRLDDAEKALRKALEFAPNNPDTNAALARVFLERGNPDAAIKQARLTLKLIASHGEAKLVEADALTAKGEIDLAIEAYQAAYGLARQNPEVLIHAARACMKFDRPTTATAFAERGTQDFPEWGPSWEALGDVLAPNDPVAARKAYQNALKLKGLVDKANVERKLLALK
jgi:tetratricopeptide (TPR) repeat protein